MTGMANEKPSSLRLIHGLTFLNHQTDSRASELKIPFSQANAIEALGLQPHTGTTDSFRLLPSSTFCCDPIPQGVDLVGRPAGDRRVGLDQAGWLAESAPQETRGHS
jgi:hypothetical protein